MVPKPKNQDSHATVLRTAVSGMKKSNGSQQKHKFCHAPAFKNKGFLMLPPSEIRGFACNCLQHDGSPDLKTMLSHGTVFKTKGLCMPPPSEIMVSYATVFNMMFPLIENYALILIILRN